MVALRTFVCAARATLLSWICSASSRVGATISARVLPETAVGQPFEDGQQKGSGLAGSGLGQADDVAAFKHHRDGALLDGSGLGKARLLDAGENARVKGKLFKLQKKALLGFMEPSRTLSPLSVRCEPSVRRHKR